MEETKRKNIDIFGILIMGLTLLILGTVLFWFMSFAMAYQDKYHDDEMESLTLEKEIALINNKEFSGDINYNRSAFPCVVEVLIYNGESYDEVYEFVNTCWEVVK